MGKKVFIHNPGNGWQKSLGRCIIWLAIFVVFFLVIENISFAVNGIRHKSLDLFSRGDISIESGQTVGMLLVAGGDAAVGGLVEKGIVVVDGNLFLSPDAHVKGAVAVLGGHVTVEAGARLEKPMVVLAPVQVPIAGLLVLGLLFLGVSSLVVIPVVLWLTAEIISSTRPYLWLKQQLSVKLERRWPTLYIAFSLAIGVLMLTFFAEMAYETLIRRQMDVFDNVLVWLTRYMANPELDRAMIAISEYGYGYPFGVIILAALITLIFYRRWLEAGGLLASLLGEAILNLGLKNLFERSRPDLFRVVEEAGYSFPSGHAMVSLCLYGMLAFLIARRIQSARWRLVVITLAVALIGAIGVSRIYLGVHYPTDVVAGYLAGGMWLAFCITLLMWWENGRVEEL